MRFSRIMYLLSPQTAHWSGAKFGYALYSTGRRTVSNNVWIESGSFYKFCTISNHLILMVHNVSSFCVYRNNWQLGGRNEARYDSYAHVCFWAPTISCSSEVNVLCKSRGEARPLKTPLEYVVCSPRYKGYCYVLQLWACNNIWEGEELHSLQ